ncbi:hypothetical protein Q5H94_05825 [Sphingomonas sp. CA1-15]|uniref:Transport permease protein n=2 Tax=Sphingomonas immobilis TaxID=3063997 RepID=A0ABT8ZYJ1_9SPHN|nr:hypothetical protein [Sphingomonas sp. CA1-15]
MKKQIIYEAGPQLRNGRRFVHEAATDLHQSLSLGFTLFQAGLQTQSRRALLGHLWLFIPAIMAVTAISYVQARGIFHFPDIGMPVAVFVFAGTTLWQLLLETLNAPTRQLIAHRGTVTRLRVPHEAMILAGVYEAFLNAAVRLGSLLILCIFLRVPLGTTTLFAPFAAVPVAMLGLAVGLLFAPITLLYEDGARGLLLVTNLLVFAMPVAYPITASGVQRFNPLIPLLDTPRNLLVRLSVSNGFAATAALAAALLLVAWFIYRLARPHIVARLG